MKTLLGATIVLLVFVTLGLAIYAYTEHREVTELTLRADSLEGRIAKLESGSSAVDRIGEEVQNGAETSASQSTSSAVTTMSLEDHDDVTPTAPTSLEDINRIRHVKYGLDPLTLEEANNLRRERGILPLPSESIQKETEEIRWPSLDSEPAMRDQIGYSDQELYESREEEPNRPECGTRVPGQIRPWWYINFLKAIGCATVEDRLDALERER